MKQGASRASLLDMRPHFVRPERAIQSDHQRLRVQDRSEKRFHRLAAEGASGEIGDRAGNQERHFLAFDLKNFRDREDRRLGIQRVEDRFDEQQVDPAFDQRRDLLA